MTDYNTKNETSHGYRVLDPLPSREELDSFFEHRYYALIEEGKRAADIARTRKGGEAAEDQTRWFRETVHQDLIDIVREHASGKQIIEVGCGMGNLLVDFRDAGFLSLGVDLATVSIAAAHKRGLDALQGAFDTLVETGSIESGSFDAVIFNNVLELTYDPMSNLAAAARALRPGGVLIVRGGNDFNPLQLAAVDVLGVPEWWVSPPEHINYLNFDAVESMMRAVSIEPIHRHGEFPMELWLLAGFDYIADPSLGAECHNRRVMLERNLPVQTRRRLYQAFGAAGMGRTMVVVGKKE